MQNTDLIHMNVLASHLFWKGMYETKHTQFCSRTGIRHRKDCVGLNMSNTDLIHTNVLATHLSFGLDSLALFTDSLFIGTNILLNYGILYCICTCSH